MPLNYTFEMISNLSFFSSIDFSVFSEFEKCITIISFNLLYYVFLMLVISLVYKIVCRVLNIIFQEVFL